MDDTPEQAHGLEDTLAEGIAAVMAANEERGHSEDLADLFLEELNRLWCEPAPLVLS